MYRCWMILTVSGYNDTLSWALWRIFLFHVIFHDTRAPSGLGPHHYRVSIITLRYTTHGRTPLDGWSVRRRDLYLTTHNKQTFMPPAGLEPAIPGRERPQTHTLDRTTTGMGFPVPYRTAISQQVESSSLWQGWLSSSPVFPFTVRQYISL